MVDKKKKVDEKNTRAPKKSIDRLKSVWRSKNNVGFGSTSVAPLVVDKEPSMKKIVMGGNFKENDSRMLIIR